MVKRANSVDFVQRVGGSIAAPRMSACSTDLQIAYLPPERLHPSPDNARMHSKKQLRQIVQSIERFGFVNPILISDDLEIIAGHGRVEAAKMLGLRLVPAVRLSALSPAECRTYRIADNRLAELAGWDREALATELQGLLDIQFDDIELTGFSLDEIDRVFEQAVQNRADQSQRAANRRRAVVSRVGDKWLLGAHRLLCGDAGRDCDVIVRRWQQYSGEAARLEGSDLTFAEVAAQRLMRQNTLPDKPEGSE